MDQTPSGRSRVPRGAGHRRTLGVALVSGCLYDKAFDLWLDAGHYASRPPGELHGPFKTDVGCVVLEVSFPNRIGDNNAAQPIIPSDAAR